MPKNLSLSNKAFYFRHFGILGVNYKDNTGHDQVKSEVERKMQNE